MQCDRERAAQFFGIGCSGVVPDRSVDRERAQPALLRDRGDRKRHRVGEVAAVADRIGAERADQRAGWHVVRLGHAVQRGGRRVECRAGVEHDSGEVEVHPVEHFGEHLVKWPGCATKAEQDARGALLELGQHP
ncbi:unannotated protein [freshwater metagenome]|uniref:Unannotated protein n=1 Tax=freshwater metagenome TaxID=449393 RepID=A0A6J7P2S1_9ZZZZ